MWTNSFLVGMKSKHSNKKEDRRYNYFYQNSPDLILTDCDGWKQLNVWDGDVNEQLGANKVIAGK